MPYLDGGIPGGLTPEEQRRQRLFTIIGGLQGLGQQRGGGGFLGGLLAGFSGGIGGQLQGEQYALEGRREARNDQRLERQNQLAELTLGSRLEEAQQQRQSREAAQAAIEQAAAAETNPSRARALRLAGMLGAPEKAVELLGGGKQRTQIVGSAETGFDLVDLDTGESVKKVRDAATPGLTPYQQATLARQDRELEIRAAAAGQPGKGPESYSLVPPDQVEKLGFPKGSVVTRSNRGNFQVEYKPSEAGGGVSITGYDDAGRPLINVGGKGGPPGPDAARVPLEKSAAGTVQKEVLEAEDQLAELGSIKKDFDATLQTIPAQVRSKLTTGFEALGFDLSPETRAKNEAYTTQRAKIAQSGALIRNRLLGQTLTASEQTSTNPFVPREDDPASRLIPKVDQLIATGESAVQRRRLALKMGLDVSDPENYANIATPTKEGVKAAADKFGQKKLEEFKAQGVPEPEAKRQVLELLKQVIGGG